MKLTHKQIKAIKKFRHYNKNDYYLKGTILSEKKFKIEKVWEDKLYSLTIKQASEIISKCVERLKIVQWEHNNAITDDNGLENDDRDIFQLFENRGKELEYTIIDDIGNEAIHEERSK